jgi:hypothetical protein
LEGGGDRPIALAAPAAGGLAAQGYAYPVPAAGGEPVEVGMAAVTVATARPRSAWLRAALPNAAEWCAPIVPRPAGRVRAPSPRSRRRREALVSVANRNDYDFGAGGDVAVRRRGKTILEADRSCYAREAGYRTAMARPHRCSYPAQPVRRDRLAAPAGQGKLEPLQASPMNGVLLGWPRVLGVQLDA